MWAWRIVIVSALFSCEFSSQFIFLLLLFFPFCLLYVSSSSQSESSGSWYWVDCAQTGHCGPHLHNSSDDTLGNGMLLLFGAELPRTTGWGITAYFGGTFSASGLFILCMAGTGMSFLFGEIGHDLATSKFIEAGTVLGHGVASLVGGMADVAVLEALDSRDAGCCSIWALLQMGISGPSSPWGFCIEKHGNSWIFALGTLYIVNGIGVDLAVGQFVDVAVGFIIKVCVAVAVVAIASGFIVGAKGFSISLTLNCFLMSILLIFFCFLSMAFLGTGAFCSEEIVGLTALLELECDWLASWSFNSR